MKISLKPSGQSYFLSNKNIFFHRLASGKFSDKWHGLWAGDFKMLDSFTYSFLIDGREFSLDEHCKRAEYSGFDSRHFYNILDLSVEEVCFVPLVSSSLVSILKIKNSSKEALDFVINLNVNVNHRQRETNWHDTKYDSIFEKHGRYLTVKSSDSSFTLFGTQKDFGAVFLPSEIYNEYFDGNDKQRTFSCGQYQVGLRIDAGKEVRIPFFFSVSKTGLKDVLVPFLDLRDLFERDYKSLKKRFKSVVDSYKAIITPEFSEVLHWSIITTELLKSNSGLFAGFPWFSQYWGRDSFWSLNALLHRGDFDEVRSILERFIKSRSAGNEGGLLGTIPNIIYSSDIVDYMSMDSTLLFVIALRDYIKHSGDTLFLRKNRQTLADIAKWFEALDEEGSLKEFSTGNLTWMDTLSRSKAVEIQALYVEACYALSDMYDFLGSPELSSFFNVQKESAKKNIEAYWNHDKGYFNDTLSRDSLTPNQLVLLFYGLIDSRRANTVLDKMLSEDMLTKAGLRSLSSDDSSFFRDAYHQGAVWGFLNGLLLCTLFGEGRVESAARLIEVIRPNLRTHALGSLSETFTGDPLEPSGCGMQLWSCALLIRSVDEFLFGIEPDMSRNVITINTNVVKGVIERHDKVLKDFFMDLRVEGHSSKAVVQVLFSKNPDVDLIVELKGLTVKKMVVNGNEVESNRFKALEENVVEFFF